MNPNNKGQMDSASLLAAGEQMKATIAAMKAHIEGLNAELATLRLARGEKGPKSAKAAPVPRDEGCPVEPF